MTKFDICVDSASRFGQNSVSITIVGSESVQCDICNNQSVVYGLCGEILKYSEIVNGIYQCTQPFEYINDQCICADGYLLDQTKCINIVKSINNLITSNANNSDHILLIEKKFLIVDNQLAIVENNILNNISEIENYIISNTSILDNRIKANITALQNNIIQSQLLIDANLLQNTTVLDWRIYNNVSILNQSLLNISQQLKDINYTKMQNTIDNLQNQLNDFNVSLQKDNQIIEQQQNTIDNLTKQINCTNNYGYSMINGSCVQVSCTISGQQNINGICQCTIINSIVQSGACICPFNSNVISSACVCSITGQTIQNGQCACSTTGAFVNNNACTCGVNSLNISNTCSCPSGANLINGVCTCSNINAYISGNSCVCPTNSSLIGNTCTCPANSQIINNICICNQIIGQIMNSGVCKCSTTGAFVSGASCTCGVNSLNISNSCSCPSGASLLNGICICTNINAYISGNSCVCPTNSSLIGNTCTCPTSSQLVNNICECNQISGQIMNNGSCQCQTTGAYVYNGVCACGVNAVNVSNTCTCPINSSLVNNVCTCDKITGQTLINGTCQCPPNQPIINNKCDPTSYLINSTNFECIQQFFTQTFDLQSITYQINTSSYFSQGYVFRSGSVTQNAFIDFQDNAYRIEYNIQPLFSYETILTNFKIQFGTQSLNNGSFLQEYINSISINQMNIISKQGTQLTLKAASKLNILSTQSKQNVIISNLLVNLSFAPSNGNITLFSQITGNLNITGYQVLGQYTSTGTVAMIGLELEQTVLNVNQITFKPSSYNVGNSSSYLFGDITYLSKIIINYLSIMLGNSSNILLLGSVVSTSTNYYQFGGITTTLSFQSTINVNNIISDSYLHISTSQVKYSGFIVGYGEKSTITIQNMCLQQSLTSIAQQFESFGLLGYSAASISIQNATVTFTVQGTFFSYFGIIGNQSTYISEVLNAKTSINVRSTNSSTCVGSIFGKEGGDKCTIQNTQIIDGNITAGQYTGGFIGYCYSKLYLTNSKIQSVRLSGLSNIGIVVGRNDGGTYIFTGSSSSSNYINNVKQNDCGTLSNNWSVVGC
ncbi:Conserved_hypothetical protein [Hexamita inflata]|uniref:Uncharacterized protein n=1 Tax=Hexamita inflata TaxID=28002 RepID=A0AA86VFK3_9EUKA|nr:Conserved hypothetical protein [Hexamita inflata]